MCTPTWALLRELEPLAAVPMKFPSTRLEEARAMGTVVKMLEMVTPSEPLADITFPAPAAVPPMLFPEPPLMATPLPMLARALAPVTSVPR